MTVSEAATRDRIVKQRWAEPGSAHDRLVRWSKVVLPSAVGVLIAVLAVAPLDRRGDVSFILDKKKVESAQERMRVETARYVGADNKGQKFEITAQRAIQRSSEVPVVDIEGMFARLALLNGPLMIAANQGQYDLDLQQVQVNGPVRVVGPDGYKLETRDVRVNLKSRQLVSSGPVSGQMRLGQFQAGRLRADLGERNVVLDGGARLKIVQGAVR
jgi:lipopolysaccharide export system protein LptC